MSKRWTRHSVEIKESILTVLCHKQYFKIVLDAVEFSRNVLENYIKAHSEFARSFEPVFCNDNDPEIIKNMCRAAQHAGVGPMASVAGAVAKTVLDFLLEAGADEAVVDNGGDIVLKVNEPVKIGVFAGKSGLNNLAFVIPPGDNSLALCTSSGTVGHSFSYGKADAAIVFSNDAFVADASATALGNRIKSLNDLERSFEIFENKDDINGAIAILGDQIALWGDLPEIIKANVDTELITKGRIYA